MEYISLKDAIRMIDAVDAGGNAAINHLVFVTADRRRRTGGQVIELKHAVVNKPRLTKVQLASYEKKKNTELVQTDRIRRVKEKYGSQVISVHIDLILMVNGKGVM